MSGVTTRTAPATGEEAEGLLKRPCACSDRHRIGPAWHGTRTHTTGTRTMGRRFRCSRQTSEFRRRRSGRPSRPVSSCALGCFVALSCDRRTGHHGLGWALRLQACAARGRPGVVLDAGACRVLCYLGMAGGAGQGWRAVLPTARPAARGGSRRDGSGVARRRQLDRLRSAAHRVVVPLAQLGSGGGCRNRGQRKGLGAPVPLAKLALAAAHAFWTLPLEPLRKLAAMHKVTLEGPALFNVLGASVSKFLPVSRRARREGLERKSLEAPPRAAQADNGAIKAVAWRRRRPEGCSQHRLAAAFVSHGGATVMADLQPRRDPLRWSHGDPRRHTGGVTPRRLPSSAPESLPGTGVATQDSRAKRAARRNRMRGLAICCSSVSSSFAPRKGGRPAPNRFRARPRKHPSCHSKVGGGGGASERGVTVTATQLRTPQATIDNGGHNGKVVVIRSAGQASRLRKTRDAESPAAENAVAPRVRALLALSSGASAGKRKAPRAKGQRTPASAKRVLHGKTGWR